MASPVIDYIADQRVPGGKSIMVPITASDSDGDLLNYYSISTTDPRIKATLYKRSNTIIRMTVTGHGVMEFELLSELAPKTVDIIKGLITAGYYDGLTFHRVMKNFMIQGGDKAGTGSGSFAYKYEDEFKIDSVFSGFGQLAMANSGNDTNGSQFFITHGQPRHLDYNHTIFGQLLRGFGVLESIAAVPVGLSDNKPTTNVVISKVEIIENKTDAVLKVTAPKGVVGSVTVRASDGSSTDYETFKVTAFTDSTNQNPYLVPRPDFISPLNQVITIALTPFDFEKDAVYIDGNYVGPVHTQRGEIQGNNIYLLPEVNYRGPISLKVGVKKSQAAVSDSNPLLDEQIVTVAVGDKPLSNLLGLTGTTYAGRNKELVVASFKDTDTTSSAGEFTASIYWGDAQVSTGKVTKVGGVYQVSGVHQYAKHGSYPVYVALTSKGGVTANLRGGVVVEDAPATTSTVPIVGYENVALNNVVVGKLKDTDPRGVIGDWTAKINWGDGSPQTDGVLQTDPEGGWRIVGTHTYTTPGGKPVVVQLTGNAGAKATINVTATIGRSTLVVNADNNRSIDEQNTNNVSNYVKEGVIADTGGGTSWTGTVNWGDGSSEPLVIDSVNKTFQLRHNYPNSGLYRVVVTILDQTGLPANSGNDVFEITVNNVKPTATITGGDTTGVRSQTRKITFSATDVSPADIKDGFRFTVDWGDGTGVNSLGNGVLEATHSYNVIGDYIVKVRAIDKDNTQSDEVTRTIKISAFELQSSDDGTSNKDLVIGATTAAEIITVEPGDLAGKLKVKIGDATLTPDIPSGVIRVYAGAGNDSVAINAGVPFSTVILGQEGNDTLTGGIGNDVLLGGSGDDRLLGSGGRDLLIGGAGKDSLMGNAGDDILIGTSSKYESDGPALLRIMKEWTRDDAAYGIRRAHLLGSGTGKNGATKLDAASFTPDYTADTLIGSTGDDLFFATISGFVKDVVKDRAATETQTNVTG